ncbi:MAG: hypothetical protein ACRDQZ_11310, partial [Mycobacteriales bacterium]
EDEASALRTGLAAIRSAAWLRRSLGRVRRRPDGRWTIRRTGGVVNRQRLAASGDGDHVLRTGGLYRRPHRTWPVA